MNKQMRLSIWPRKNRMCFLADAALNGREEPSFMTGLPVSGRRLVAVACAILVAAMLHGGLLFWYIMRPVPLPITAATPLPMISMELSAPPKEVVKPKTDKLKVKPKPKPKPKAQPSERLVKQVEEVKPEPVNIPPAVAPPAPNYNTPAPPPSNDTYVPVDSNVAYLRNPKPEYPFEARRRHWQGTVILRVYVEVDGHAQKVVLQRSSGYEVLDESALETVKDWRFVPAKRGDIAEASWIYVPIVFKLG